MDIVNAAASDNIEMPSIYCVVEAAREWLVDNNVEGQVGPVVAMITTKQIY